MKKPPKLPLDENLLKAIGTFVARFSLLELEIHFLVWRLLDRRLQGLGKRITNALGFQELLRILGSLFEYRTNNDELITRMRKLVLKLNAAGRDRNDILHSFWVDRPNIEEALVIRMQSRIEGFREELLDYAPKTLYAKADEFASLLLEVKELHYAISNTSPSMRME